MLAGATALGGCAGSGNRPETGDVEMQTPGKTDVAETIAVSVEPAEPDSLHFESASGLEEYLESSPDAGLYAEGIIGHIAGENLEYAERLLNSDYDNFIIVDKQRMKVMLYDRYGRELESYGMACAKNYGTKHKKGDSRTPEGFFSVKGVYDSTEWLFTDDEGYTSPKKGQFGPRFIRLDIPTTTQIGIHGTCAPWSIGGRSSHGCIRIENENILKLAGIVKKGMPVIVNPGKRDMAVNAREGFDVPHITTLLKKTMASCADSETENLTALENDCMPRPDDSCRVTVDEGMPD